MTHSEKITTSRNNGAITISGGGELDLRSADEFKAALKEATDTESPVVVDFTSTTYIDTAILAALVVAARTTMQGSRRIRVLVAEGSHPQYVIKTMGLAGLMDIEVGSSPT